MGENFENHNLCFSIWFSEKICRRIGRKRSMRYKYSIMTLLLALLAIVPATAQISVDAPEVVGVNEQFNITFTLGEKASNFDWSPSDDFQLVWGPQTGSSKMWGKTSSALFGSSLRRAVTSLHHGRMPRARLNTFSIALWVVPMDIRAKSRFYPSR